MADTDIIRKEIPPTEEIPPSFNVPNEYATCTWLPKDELATEPLKYAEQLPVAQIIHQKPKQKDWHPPGGFILGLWALIIMVFFKTYGIKHMKHVF